MLLNDFDCVENINQDASQEGLGIMIHSHSNNDPKEA
jgi:hypothetical protein